MRLAFRTVLLITALAVLALAAPSGASALSCGDTVTSNVKLTADLDCSASATNGLIVGKSGITINLNNHTITGPGGTAYDGIDNEDGFDKITLKNGTINDYEYDVLFEYTTGSKIEGITAGFDGLPGSYSGISFWYSQNGSITKSVVSNSNSEGFYLYENNNVNLSRSKSVSPLPSADGVYDYYSLSSVDHVKANGGHYGFYIENPFVGYELTDNTANDNVVDGFYIYDNYPSNLYQANLTGNVANGNGDYGFYADLKTLGKKNHASGNTTQDCHHVSCSG
jgi:hypothetical protein